MTVNRAALISSDLKSSFFYLKIEFRSGSEWCATIETQLHFREMIYITRTSTLFYSRLIFLKLYSLQKFHFYWSLESFFIMIIWVWQFKCELLMTWVWCYLLSLRLFVTFKSSNNHLLLSMSFPTEWFYTTAKYGEHYLTIKISLIFLGIHCRSVCAHMFYIKAQQYFGWQKIVFLTFHITKIVLLGFIFGDVKHY